MNNEFIPYEQALELKELGFEEPCMAAYVLGQFYFKGDNYIYGSKDIPNINAPLYQQAFRWFIENYAIDSWIRPNLIIDTPKTYQFVIDDDIDDVWYDKYEEAELACLKKLIEIVKQK